MKKSMPTVTADLNTQPFGLLELIIGEAVFLEYCQCLWVQMGLPSPSTASIHNFKGQTIYKTKRIGSLQWV